MNQFNVASNIIFGEGSIKEIIGLIASYKATNILLVTDKSLRNLGLVTPLETLIKSTGTNYTIFDAVMPNPTDSLINQCVSNLDSKAYDMIVAIGGGSVLDAAKAINVLLSNGGKIQDYFEPGKIKSPTLPLIAIPTTSGTASEITSVSVITDTINKQKMVIMGPGVSADHALLDYSLTYDLPASITASTGMDALTHAIESYVSTLATPFTDANAKMAIELITENLPLAMKNRNDKIAREKMMLASTLAGIAFNSAILGLVHAVAHPLGAHYNVPHGVANAMILPYVMAYNSQYCGDKLCFIGNCLGLTIEESTGDNIKGLLLKMNEDFDIPTLASTGIKESDFNMIADAVMREPSIQMNPRRVEKDLVMSLLKEAYKNK